MYSNSGHFFVTAVEPVMQSSASAKAYTFVLKAANCDRKDLTGKSGIPFFSFFL